MLFKYIPAVCLLLGCILATTCLRTPSENNGLYGKTWLHAHEEDTDDIKIYRPNTYHFPPSRGRTGFSLDADGTFRLLAIAPTDGLEEHTGKWELEKKNLLQVTFPDKESENFELELISVTEELLKVKFLPAAK